MKYRTGVVVFLFLILFFPASSPVQAQRNENLITMISEISPPSISYLDDNTVTKFTFNVEAVVINPTPDTLSVPIPESSHSRIYIDFELENSFFIDDVYTQSPSTTSPRDIAPGEHTFNLEAEIYIFEAIINSLPVGNYTFFFSYGQVEENTYFAYMHVQEGMIKFIFEEYPYEGTSSIQGDNSEAGFHILLLSSAMLIYPVIRKIKKQSISNKE